MDLRLLRYFLAVVDEGTVTGAAQQLHVAQPSISRQLHHLERDLGVTLFSRVGSRLQLTAVGRDVVPIVRDLLQRSDWARSQIRQLAGESVGRLRLAAPVSTVSEVIAPFLATLSAVRDPLLLVREVSPPQAYETLDDDVDVAISSLPVPRPLAGRRLFTAPIRAYVGPGHPWFGRRSVTVAELVEERLILLTGDHLTRVVIDREVARSGLGYGDVVECEVPRTVQGLSAAGFGVGVVTDFRRLGACPLLIRSSSDGREPIGVDLFVAWRPDHYAASTIESLAERIARFAAAVIAASVEPAELPTVGDG